MAYLVDIVQSCDRCKTRPAVVRLKNNRNADCGSFCKPCGNRKLKELQLAERGKTLGR